MNDARTKRALLAPNAPLSPPADQVGKVAGEPLGATVVGEMVAWTFTVELRATAEDPFGRDIVQHRRDHLKVKGFVVTEPRLVMPARLVPRAVPPAPNR